MSVKQLVIAVDGTAEMGFYWAPILSDYLVKIIRYLCGQNLTGQEASGGRVELSLVMYNSHGPYSGFLTQDSRTTRSMGTFLQWLSAISFSGDGYDDLAIAEGLADALLMFPRHPHGTQTQQRLLGRRHCILVAASNPFPFPIPVHLPKIQNLQGAQISGATTEFSLADPNMVAKLFTQCCVSLSVISPKQLPKLREIYNSANSNLQGENSLVNGMNPQFLILISKNFPEAHAALNEYNVTSTPSIQNPV
ncbi:hypothetical protein VitviT2T_025919 [Vitis vinifera]|uniref:Mediator of RNA polymerase II transcription subunit 25 n=2 Tax=Vitis vinifera TaxID=29760 RepID=A0ABY9DNI8_VITVI|nr:mediator of RNA polymerase II transcription subunit 25 [Vitis vinifera]RVX14263.1 Mediator of RNA polymerase II transcription subunit 25 [Vitis vinifera]WKA08175.1 hypothetical protein VitviT2T_025919 [Vitis vinifera]|eukprot:XP_019082124.1 PREDICTED: mediator of RNA polymerase II transcription subunit 25-like [Vitis vinifera]